MTNSNVLISNSDNLVFLSKENVPLTTTAIIADALNYEHRNVLILLRKYLDEFESYGHVGF
jgi:hypothetical protein